MTPLASILWIIVAAPAGPSIAHHPQPDAATCQQLAANARRDMAFRGEAGTAICVPAWIVSAMASVVPAAGAR